MGSLIDFSCIEYSAKMKNRLIFIHIIIILLTLSWISIQISIFLYKFSAHIKRHICKHTSQANVISHDRPNTGQFQYKNVSYCYQIVFILINIILIRFFFLFLSGKSLGKAFPFYMSHLVWL